MTRILSLLTPLLVLQLLLLLTASSFICPANSELSKAGNETTQEDPFGDDEAPDFEYLARMAMFVEDHPELAELAEKVRTGDMAAKSEYEKKSFSIKFNNTKADLPSGAHDLDVVLHFLDSYISERAGPEENSGHSMMRLLPLMNSNPGALASLVELGRSLANASCDSKCVRAGVTDVMTSLISMFMMQNGGFGADDDDDQIDYDYNDDHDASESAHTEFSVEGPALGQKDQAATGTAAEQLEGSTGKPAEATGAKLDEL